LGSTRNTQFLRHFWALFTTQSGDGRKIADLGYSRDAMRSRSFTTVMLLSALGVAACTRRAPGPAECERFALQVTGVSDARMLAVPRIKAGVDDWTVRCLTTPYDDELLACVDRGERGCYQRFAARHPERAARDVQRLR
jgi:hypothetical protein